MRNVSLIHTVLAALLCCAVVFVFAGVNFMKYESAARSLRDSRINAGIVSLHKTIQLEMDKGYPLSELKQLEKELVLYAKDEPDLISVAVFDTKSGKKMFDTDSSQKGKSVPETWRKKCNSPDSVFTEREEKKEFFGIPLFNAIAENTGCLVGEYSVDEIASVREKMIKTAFSKAFRLAGISVAACFLVYFYGLLISTILTNKKIQTAAVLMLFQVMLGVAFYFNFKETFSLFENDLEQEIAVKTRFIAKMLGKQISRTLQTGVPFDAIPAPEVYMDQLRQDNKEILFVLVTDKTGRVLYESGKAAEAFETDPHTGKISLKYGYYNAAEPINNDKNAIGWVQIGVNERFMREKIL